MNKNKIMNNTTDSLTPTTAKTTRRNALRGLGLGALGLASLNLIVPKAKSQVPTTNLFTTIFGTTTTTTNQDIAILNFALNLEYLEAEYYTRATTGGGIQSQGVGITGTGKLGNVVIKANPIVPFNTPAIQQYALEFAEDERNHVSYLRSVLGASAVARPPLNLQNSFTVMAQAAGVVGAGETFDPFADEVSFLLGAYYFEDVGVTAYRGAISLLANRTLLSAAAGIMGTEAYHAGNIRTQLFETGVGPQNATVEISDLRDALDENGNQDQGVVLDGVANITPVNAVGMVFTRTARQVLDIVYLGTNATKGGFYPNGFNP
jgi:Ferritin-like domain